MPKTLEIQKNSNYAIFLSPPVRVQRTYETRVQRTHACTTYTILYTCTNVHTRTIGGPSPNMLAVTYVT